jgi:hypothetical protein
MLAELLRAIYLGDPTANAESKPEAQSIRGTIHVVAVD